MMISYKNLKLYQRPYSCLCFTLIFICVMYYKHYTQRENTKNRLQEPYDHLINESSEDTRSTIPQTTSRREKKIILLWTKYFNKWNWMPSTDELQCPVKDCFVTSNRSFLNNSSSVILHWRDINPHDLPICKHPNGTQNGKCPLLVLFNNEAPPNTPKGKISKLREKIHWIVTYRRDSDIYAPYGTILERTSVYKPPEMNSNRSLVCWLVSNCKTPSQREIYIKELMKYLKVDIYGKCSRKMCPMKKVIDCYKWLSNRCKFYLSFENSICEDYVTEKLFYALLTDMVPIVRGGANYSELLPPHSVIDVKDFSTPKDLAERLIILNNDEEQYLSYFKWKEHYEVKNVSYIWLCELCEKLHKVSAKHIEPYKELSLWWFSKSSCMYKLEGDFVFP